MFVISFCEECRMASPAVPLMHESHSYPKSEETHQFKSKSRVEIKKVFKQISKDIEPQCIQVSADVYEKFGPNLPRA